MSELLQIIKQIKAFRDARDWEQFHNSKDLAIAISVEASELLELFLWKDNEGADRERIEEEIADIFMFGFLLADKQGLDIKEIIEKKLKKNNEKYPVEKSKGNARKYNEL
jgi:NTP pyrophosphatase (non-canonical NTP hydrolase)